MKRGSLSINNPRIWTEVRDKPKWYGDIIRIFIRPILFISIIVCLERSIYYFSLAFK